MDNDLEYKLVKPDKSLGDFVEGFWLLQSHLDNNKDVIVLPDGRIDLVFYKSTTKSIEIILVGLGTQYEQATITPKNLAYAISFKPLATEYIFHENIANLWDTAKNWTPYLQHVFQECKANPNTILYHQPVYNGSVPDKWYSERLF